MGSTEPVVIDERVDPPTAVIRLRVPADLEYFAGHFPGVPIVPGVVQVQWAILFARRYLHLSADFAGLEALKFHQVMGPETEATLTLEYSAETAKIYFSFESDRGRHSSGRVSLQAS
jgi:3-hydroxymyristoyl/3-hydroxydecanoyl-(acyl carrier protein) dehydratase